MVVAALEDDEGFFVVLVYETVGFVDGDAVPAF